jgi:hypothetical protein
MAIAFDAVTTEKGSSDSFTFSHTVTGADPCLVVCVSDSLATLNDVSGITYNGAALTKAIEVKGPGNAPVSQIWYIAAPSTGANDVVVTRSTATDTIIAALSFTGVHQTAPLGTAVSLGGNSISPSKTITTGADDSWCVDCIGFESTVTATVGAGQTQRYNTTQGGVGAAGSTEAAGTAPDTRTFSWSFDASAKFALTIIELVPVGAVAQKTFTGADTDYTFEENLILEYNTSFYRVGIQFTANSYTWISSGGFVTKANWDNKLGTIFDRPRVANATLILDNPDGRFSPENPSGPYYGMLLPEKPLQIRVTYQGSTRQLYNGTIASFKLGAELGKRTTTLKAHDKFEKLKRRIVNMPIRADYNVGSLATEVLSYVGFSGTDVNLDSTNDRTPFAWYTDKEADKVMSDVIETGDYKFFVAPSGVINMRNRYYDVLTNPVGSMTEYKSFDYEFSAKSVKNEITVTGKPRKIRTDPGTIAWLENPINIPAGSGHTGFVLEYVDTDNPNTGDTPAQSVSVASFQAWTNSAGYGTDLTAVVSAYISTQIFGSSIVCTVTNIDSRQMWLTQFVVQGYAIQEKPEIRFTTRDSSSQAIYGNLGLSIDNDLIGEYAFARDYAKYLLEDNRQPVSEIGIDLINEYPQIIDWGLSDRLTLSESHTSIVGSTYTITGYKHTLDMAKGSQHKVGYDLRFWRDRQWFVLDSTERGILNVNKLGF